MAGGDSRRRRAGGGADDRGLEIEIVGLCLLLVAIGVAWLALKQATGAGALVLLGVAYVIYRVADERIEVGKRWQRGGRGEKTVGRILESLEQYGWLIEHDLMKPTGGNIDHVAAGPTGVFSIETKLNRFAGKRGIAQARSHARYLSKRLGCPVTPLICLARGTLLPSRYGDVTAVGAVRLVEFLASQPGPSAPKSPEFVEALRSLRSSAPADSPRPETDKPRTGRWIPARHPGRCRQCNGSVVPGDRVWHDPGRRAVWCARCAPGG